MQIGATLKGLYLIEAQLGEGGFGKVFKAKNIKNGRYFAIKKIGYQTYWDPSTRELVKAQFQKEINLSRVIIHPNLQKYVEDFWIGDEQYLVTQLEKGKSLKAWLDSGIRFSQDEAIDIALQILEGLAVIHSHNVTHFDVKDENILYDRDGSKKAVLLDYGISRANGMGGKTQFASAHTPYYGAPEQAANGMHDGRTDIYSLGVTLYEMITHNVQRVFLECPQNRYINDTVVDFPGLSPAMKPIIKKATGLMPNHRYSTTGEMMSALRAVRTPPRQQVVIPPTPPKLTLKPALINLGKVQWYDDTEVLVTVDFPTQPTNNTPLNITFSGQPSWIIAAKPPRGSSVRQFPTLVTLKLKDKRSNPGKKTTTMTVEYDGFNATVPISVEIGKMPSLVASPNPLKVTKPNTRYFSVQTTIKNLGGSAGNVTVGWRDYDQYVDGQPTWQQTSWPNNLKCTVDLRNYRGRVYDNAINIYIKDQSGNVIDTLTIPFEVQF
jgi:serine/threonine protein kinase